MLLPLTVALLFTVTVFDAVPPDIVNPLAAGVGVMPLIVLFVKASTPAKVAKVPVAGKINSVAPVVFKVMSDALPEPVVPVVVNAAPVFTLPPRVIVLPVLATPVPPFAPNTMPVTLVDVPNKSAVITPAVKSPFTSLFTI